MWPTEVLTTTLLIVFGFPHGQPSKSDLHCLLASQLCAQDSYCTSLLTVILHICGPRTVACSTTTVTKCQAGLRTLQAFHVFNPTCLCRQPSLDPECNSFRNFLFDHPCMSATQKDKDLYPIHALPTCTHALEVCEKNTTCIKFYKNFKEHCRARDGVCRDRDSCHNSWRDLRMTPLFGCICPNSPHKKKCDRVYNSIYNNSCIGHGSFVDFAVISSVADEPILAPVPHVPIPETNERSFPLSWEKSWTPSFRSSKALDSSTRPDPIANDIHGVVVLPGTVAVAVARDTSLPSVKSMNPNSLDFPIFPSIDRSERSISGSPNPTPSTGLTDPQQIDNPLFKHGYHQHDFEVAGLSHIIQTPYNTIVSGIFHPNSSRNGSGSSSNTGVGGSGGDGGGGGSDVGIEINGMSSSTGSPNELSNTTGAEENEMRVIIYQSTCHRAFNQCQAETTCRPLLDKVLRFCGHRCNREQCMQALQSFYRNTSSEHSLEVAFCVCKKTEDRSDTCSVAQERLHPDCARRPDRLQSSADIPEGSNAIMEPPCHILAKDCREHPDCKPRLEHYEQACAVDVATKGCAGPPSQCRRAVLGILGTGLRTSCSCRGNDPVALYDCLEWKRLLWLNPCVAEAQRDFHRKQEMKTTATPSATVPFSIADPITRRGSVTENSTPYKMEMYSSTTEIPIKNPTRFCTLKLPNNRIVEIPEGMGKRLYKDDDPNCSQLCKCGLGEMQTCTISDCPERKSCQSSAAIYTHTGAAFQAYRGECLCFSGSFVCAKPDLGQYHLPSGVFLFLGYSKIDERAMYHFTNLTVAKHLLPRLQHLLENLENHQNECRISVHEQVEENIILQIRLAELDHQRANESVTFEMHRKEKDKCSVIANQLRRMVNHRLPEIHEDELLSVVKVADVLAVLPEPSRSSSTTVDLTKSLLVITLLMICPFILPSTLIVNNQWL